jgi:hypothetical protein
MVSVSDRKAVSNLQRFQSRMGLSGFSSDNDVRHFYFGNSLWSLSKITVAFEKLNESEAHRRCLGVVMPLLMHTYLVSDITEIIKISNCSIHSSLGPTECQSLSDMLRPSMQTLKHLVVNIQVVDLTTMTIPCSIFLPSSRSCALRILSESSSLSPPHSLFERMQVAAEELTGVGLTNYSQLRGGFC